MKTGKNEPVAFTRDDAERLRAIEVKQDITLKYLHKLQYANEDIVKAVRKNTHFRNTTTRILLWFLPTGAGLALLAAGVKAMGWLN